MNTKRQARRAPPLSTLVLDPPPGSTQLIRHLNYQTIQSLMVEKIVPIPLNHHASSKKARLPLQLHAHKKASPQGATSFDFGPRPTFRINAVNPATPTNKKEVNTIVLAFLYSWGPKKARLSLGGHEYKKASPQGATSFDFGPRSTFRINAVNPATPTNKKEVNTIVLAFLYSWGPKKARLSLGGHEYKKASPQGATSFDFGPRSTFRINAVNPTS